MNLVEAYVVEVLSEPRMKYGKWWVEVKVSSYGRESVTSLMFDTESETKEVGIDYECLI